MRNIPFLVFEALGMELSDILAIVSRPTTLSAKIEIYYYVKRKNALFIQVYFLGQLEVNVYYFQIYTHIQMFMHMF